MSYHNKRRASNRQILALAFQETMFVAAWGALAGALFMPLTSLWMYAILPAVLIAIHFLVSMETSGDASPLIYLEMKQFSAGKILPRKRIYYRILLTVILFPAALIGYIPLLFGKKTLPELFTGIALSATDRRLDPRHPAAIQDTIKKAAIRVRTLTIVPMAAAAAAFFLLHSAPEVMLLQSSNVQEGLPEHEQELLTHYLELTALHPGELEYHVRLASLYFRNNMQQDLMNELSIIEGIDPTHAILILADSTAFSFEMLEPPSGDSSGVDTLNIFTVTEAPPDSTETDSTTTDSLVVPVDSLTAAADSLIILPADTAVIVPDTLPAETQVPDTLPLIPDVEETVLPESTITPVSDEIQETEEEVVEQDTLVQP